MKALSWVDGMLSPAAPVRKEVLAQIFIAPEVTGLRFSCVTFRPGSGYAGRAMKRFLFVLALCLSPLVANSAEVPSPKPTGTFRFEVDSVQPRVSYTYSVGAERKTVSASPGFSLAILTFTATNDTHVQQRFSTEDIVVVDANRQEVKKASFHGLADSTPEGGGTTQLIRHWFYDEENSLTGTSRGKLNDALSFVEWSVKPGKTLTGTLVFTVPSSGQGPYSAKLALLEHQKPPPSSAPKASSPQQL